MTRRRRKDSQHLKDAAEHLQVLREHLARGSLDDVLIRDAVSHRLEVAIDAVAKVSPELLEAEAPAEWPKIHQRLAHTHDDNPASERPNTGRHDEHRQPPAAASG
jgi:hypothetical protein